MVERVAESVNLTGVTGDVWFAYDGECPICKVAATALRIRSDIGALHLVDARAEPEHPLIGEISNKSMDLNQGMVLKFNGPLYHGEDALHMMALLGSRSGWFNRFNALIFRSRTVAKLCYPAMRLARNTLLRLSGQTKIRNLLHSASNDAEIFKPVFANDWDNLPKVMRDHYAVRPDSDDVVIVDGKLDVHVSPLMKAIAKVSGMMISRSGTDVPVTVTFRSGRFSNSFHFDRVFHFPGDIQHFRSRMERVGGNELVEFMRFGVGWKLAYNWDGERIILNHRGYVLRIFNTLIPVPLALLIGKGWAEEIPLSVDSFRMRTSLRHPLFGEWLGYAGEFKVREVVCRNAS